jgi:class 3 adenylate cyclase
MAEREVRYCTTEDGVNIAYCVEGHGPTTILALPVFFESFALDHLMPVYQEFYRELGRGRRIIRFDWRGTGLSTQLPPGAAPYGTAVALADLRAVTRAAGQPCVLWASTLGGLVSLAFASSYPELVSHLILYGTYARVNDAFAPELLDGLRSMVKANWQIAAQTIADTNGRREYPDEAGQLGDWYFQSISAEAYLAITDPDRLNEDDLTHLLPAITAPTAVLHRIADPVVPLAAGQRLAAGIPGARFVPLEGEGHLFCLGDYRKILAAVDDFLGDRDKPPAASVPEPSSFRTVLFTDLVGHTEMMSRLGDVRGREVLREHETITRNVLKQHGGTEVKTMGDGFMASFGSVTKAVECAIALQKAFSERAGEPLSVRVGLNAGEPIAEDGPDGRVDLFGATVILASRIAARANGGEVLVANAIRELCAGKGFAFSDRGDFVAKGFEEPVRVYEVAWRPHPHR